MSESIRKSASVPHPQDIIQSSLTSAVEFITSADPTKLAATIVASLDTFLKDLIPDPPHQKPEDKCSEPDPAIAGFCAQETLAMATAANTYSGAQMSAASSLRSALGVWTLALSQYQFSVTVADASLRATVKTAVDAYNERKNADSQSRNLFFYFTMQEAVAAATEVFETSMASAGSTLAGGAGTLIGAWVTCVTAIQGAQVIRQVSEAAAHAAFWQSVESTRDAT